MKPSEYFRDLVEPTIAEFEKEPESVRRAYAACVFTYHFADAAAVHSGRKSHQIADELTGMTPAFGLVRDIANLTKHLVLDPKRPGNKGRPLPRMPDTHVGPEAAFTDGTFFSDGTSWSDSKPVVRTREGHGRLVDVAWCVTQARRAIEGYLQRPDMR
jgi:hypothetical protein